MGPNSQI